MIGLELVRRYLDRQPAVFISLSAVFILTVISIAIMELPPFSSRSNRIEPRVNIDAATPPAATYTREEINPPQKVSWIGMVNSKMTYGRLRLDLLDGNDEYSEFVAEPWETDGEGPFAKSPLTKNIKVGEIVRITGMWTETSDNQPWVTIEKVEEEAIFTSTSTKPSFDKK